MSKVELYKKAWEKWGEYSQLDMIIEECSELIKAIQKYKRGLGTLDHIIEEIGDVEIMTEEFKTIYDPKDLKTDGYKISKLIKLKRLLEE